MAPRPQPERTPWPRLVLRRVDQAMCGAVLAIALSLLAGHWAMQSRTRGRLIEIDRAEPLSVQFQVDVNAAQWPELTLLPGIGEVLARRIVTEREQHGPFRDHDDLRRVYGIGPKTLDGMRPYLIPLPDWEATAGDAGSGGSGTVN